MPLSKSEKLLILAIKNRDKNSIIQLLKTELEFNYQDNEGYTALLLSAENNYIDILKKFLEKGVSVGFRSGDDYTALMHAVQSDYINIIKELLGREANFILRNDIKESVLRIAAQHGHIEIVTGLLEKGVSGDFQNKDGYTALMRAAQNGHFNIVKELLEKGVIVNLQNKDGYTALMRAVQNGHLNIVMELLRRGADVNLKNDKKESALILAAERGYIDIVKELLEKKANIDDSSKYGSTALNCAVSIGRIDIVNELLEKGANINLQNEYGYTALMSAAHNDRIDIVKKLLGKKANVNIQSKDGHTALMFASGGNHIDIVKELLKYGANVNLRNEDKESALLLAAERGYIDIVKELLDKGANFKLPNNYGSTALKRAVQNGHFDIVKELLIHGANITLKNKYNTSALTIVECRGSIKTSKKIKQLIEIAQISDSLVKDSSMLINIEELTSDFDELILSDILGIIASRYQALMLKNDVKSSYQDEINIIANNSSIPLKLKEDLINILKKAEDINPYKAAQLLANNPDFDINKLLSNESKVGVFIQHYMSKIKEHGIISNDNGYVSVLNDLTNKIRNNTTIPYSFKVNILNLLENTETNFNHMCDAIFHEIYDLGRNNYENSRHGLPVKVSTAVLNNFILYCLSAENKKYDNSDIEHLLPSEKTIKQELEAAINFYRENGIEFSFNPIEFLNLTGITELNIEDIEILRKEITENNLAIIEASIASLANKELNNYEVTAQDQAVRATYLCSLLEEIIPNYLIKQLRLLKTELDKYYNEHGRPNTILEQNTQKQCDVSNKENKDNIFLNTEFSENTYTEELMTIGDLVI